MINNFFILLILTCLNTIYPSPPIIDGIDYDDSIFPAVVMLEKDDGHFCTGTYVGPNTILTASHCVEKKLFKESGVIKLDVFHTYKIKGTSVNIKATILHHGSDLAIIITKDKNKNFLPVSFEKLTQNQPVIMVGYGQDCVYEHTFSNGAGVKRVGYNKINVLSEINKTQSFNVKETVVIKRVHDLGLEWGTIWIHGQADYKPFAVCSNSFDASTSFGDSGGPLIIEQSDVKGVVGVSYRFLQCLNGKLSQLSTYTKSGDEVNKERNLNDEYNDIRSEKTYPYPFCSKGSNETAILSGYSMLRRSIPFFKFAIKNGADIKIINVNLEDYKNVSPYNEYFRIFLEN